MNRKFVTKQEIGQARRLDLLSYLQKYRPGELVKISPGVYSMRSHDSLKLSNGRWYQWSRGVGGVSALDYLVLVENVPFVDAVAQLLDKAPRIPAQNSITLPSKQPAEFKLPKKNGNNDRVIAYLMQRGISNEVIEKCVKEGILFEDARHNCCFVGRDEQGIPRYAMLRSSSPHHTFLLDVAGSNKEHSFRLSEGASDTLYLFESAIDLLSFFELNGQQAGHYLSVAGVYQPKKGNVQDKLPAALSHFLSVNSQIRRIQICFDNDTAGNRAATAIEKRLNSAYEVKLSPPEVGKDYNDQLLALKGLLITVKTRNKNKKDIDR